MYGDYKSKFDKLLGNDGSFSIYQKYSNVGNWNIQIFK